ncbi:MAG: MGH1-like glycoside hydrolase domain-containing protein [Vulcanimicrobiaceae bacterium]
MATSSGRALPTFIIADGDLGMGASLGNSAIWLNTKNTGAIERVFCHNVAQSLVGTVTIRYGSKRRAGEQYITLHRDGEHCQFEIHPAYQRVRFTFGGAIEVRETTFVPFDALIPSCGDSPTAYRLVEVLNGDEISHDLRIVGSARLRGSMPSDVHARFDQSLNALVAWNASVPHAVRIFGSSEAPTHFETNFDFGSTYDPRDLPILDDRTDEWGDVLGQLQFDLTVEPGERRTLCFYITVSGNGDDDALKTHRDAPPAKTALERTIAHLEDVLHNSEVLTPDPFINQGALWSKVNMRRVMATYPQGCAFTNDPGNSANVVVRDAAWFVNGNDHFMPHFSRDLLDNIGAHQYASGKLPEFYDAVKGSIEDDGLNINDDTPLYIIAINHHYRSTGDLEWLARMYQSVSTAARYIISQTDERGLVFCSANDPRGSVWAIAGWRNIIPNYSINGAVTEINAECVAALRAAAHLAENLGVYPADAAEFKAASLRIRNAMDVHLINPQNGLYYLNIDVDGNVHTDVTGDEIFPVMLRACDEDTGFRIISRLNAVDFWTPAGLRTISREDPLYEPSDYWGLLGGVWPGLTWWYAFAAASYHPEFMVRALRSSFAHYAVSPKKNNTVPGQFSEWFDGESLTNKGMRLSPWEPPRFLWAAVEGVCGLMLSPSAPSINPLIPPDWNWVALRRLPYHGSLLSYFAVRESDGNLHMHSTSSLRSECDLTVYERDVSDDVRTFSHSAAVVALARKDCAAILIGNTEAQTVALPVDFASAIDPEQLYRMRVYNSERRGWEEQVPARGRNFESLPVSIEAYGFRLIELQMLPAQAP